MYFSCSPEVTWSAWFTGRQKALAANLRESTRIGDKPGISHEFIKKCLGFFGGIWGGLSSGFLPTVWGGLISDGACTFVWYWSVRRECFIGCGGTDLEMN
jgi:hypothetical protein